MLGLVSIFYALALGLIPFIAKRIISGDVGSSAYALVRAAAVAVGAAVSAGAGFAAGAGAVLVLRAQEQDQVQVARARPEHGRSRRKRGRDVFVHAATAAKSCPDDSLRHDERGER